jgi:hypothetical protein
MLRVTVVDVAGEEHRFEATGPHEDYEAREDPSTGELVVDHVTYGHRGTATRARTGSQVVAAWPAGTWRTASRHSSVAAVPPTGEQTAPPTGAPAETPAGAPTGDAAADQGSGGS